MLLFGADFSRVTALRGAEDLVADLVFLVLGAIAGRGGDDAGELGAGDPGEGRLVLVFAADLEQVVEVGGGGVDGNGVLVGLRVGVREGGDLEVEGALLISVPLGHHSKSC